MGEEEYETHESLAKAMEDSIAKHGGKAAGGEPTTWVEREVPEHLEDAAHDLITALLKSHGYKWDGEKQDDN